MSLYNIWNTYYIEELYIINKENCVLIMNICIKLLIQDVAINAGFGAFTGETSAALLTDAGIKWTLTGHSERRVGFGGPGETSDMVGKKTAVAIAGGLSVIACIGEMLAERENGTTMVVCSEQLAAITKCLKEEDWKKVVIAYG
jgi:triosephosphate isomerase